jgi:hypothetical protein
VRTLDFPSLERYVEENKFLIDQKTLGEKEWNVQSTRANQLIDKIESSGKKLEEYCGSRIYRGILSGLNEAFIIDEMKKNELIAEDAGSAEILKPCLIGSEVKRYSIKSERRYMILTKVGVEIDRYPAIKRHLSGFQKDLEARWDQGDHWWELRTCAYYEAFQRPKIVWANLATKASFAYDENGFYVNNPACIIPTDSKYVLGLLNSKLFSFYLRSICAERQGGFIEQKPVYVKRVRIRPVPDDQMHSIVGLVERMLSLNKRLNEIGDKKTGESARIESEITKTDAEIDNRIYRLYNLTAEEVRIIEESVPAEKA